MTFPLGEWLLFSVSFFAFLEWPLFKLDKRLRLLPMLWILGWLLESIMMPQHLWHWHYSRIFVLVGLAWLAWKRTPERKGLPFLLITLTLLGQNLFSINEPGIFRYDHWAFALGLLCIAVLSAQTLWGTAFAITTGMLFNLGLSIFLYDGIVSHYDLPDPFLWHFSSAALVGLASMKQVLDYSRKKFRQPFQSEAVLMGGEPLEEEISSLEEQEPTII